MMDFDGIQRALHEFLKREPGYTKRIGEACKDRVSTVH